MAAFSSKLAENARYSVRNEIKGWPVVLKHGRPAAGPSLRLEAMTARHAASLSVVYPLNPDVGDKGVRGQFTAVFCGTDGCHLWNGPVRGAGGRINGRRAVFSSKFAGAVCP